MKISMEKRNRLHGLMFISPFIIGTFLFFFFPIISSITLSFGKIDSVQGFQTHFIGLDNYIKAFVTDLNYVPNLIASIQNMLLYTPFIIIFSIILSIMINSKFALRGFFRVVFFLPFLLGTGYVMSQLLGQNIQSNSLDISRGLIVPEQIIKAVGPQIATYIYTYLSIITLVLWKSGVQILLFLSGLQAIPVSLYESSKCDGATEWEMFWKITLPMLSPVILLNIVFTIIVSFTDITNNLIHYIYSITFDSPVQFEYGAAMGWIYFLFVSVIIALVFLIMRKFTYLGDNKKG